MTLDRILWAISAGLRVFLGVAALVGFCWACLWIASKVQK